MVSCLTAARYNQTVDIYVQQKTQAPSGAVGRVWVYQETLPCLAQSIHTLSVTDQASGKKFRQQYREYDAILVFTDKILSKRYQLHNILQPDGVTPFWPDDEGNPVVFEVQGSKPIINGFNRVVEHETLAMRTEVQNA